MVCYDVEFPEWVRARRPWPAPSCCACRRTGRARAGPPASARWRSLRAMAAAATNRMAIALCDRCGTERGVDWVAGSSIVGPRRLAARRPARARRAGRAARRRRPRRLARQGARSPQRRARRPPPRPVRMTIPTPRPSVDAGVNVTITGATGRVGGRIVAALQRARRQRHRAVPRPGAGGRGAGRRGRRLAARRRSRPRPPRSPGATA